MFYTLKSHGAEDQAKLSSTITLGEFEKDFYSQKWQGLLYLQGIDLSLPLITQPPSVSFCGKAHSKDERIALVVKLSRQKTCFTQQLFSDT